MSAEPTAEQRETAMVACGHRGWTTEQLSLTQRERVNNVARALASQRADIVARYEAVADQLTDAARATDSALARSVLASSILAIRKAAPK